MERGVALDEAGRHLAVVTVGRDDAVAILSVYDLRKGGQPVATATRAGFMELTMPHVGFVGPLLVWVEDLDQGAGPQGELWKLAGRKLKRVATLDGPTHAWGRVGDGRYAIAGAGDVAIWDVGAGKLDRTIHVDGVTVGADDQVSLATTDGGFALLAGRRVAFVDLATDAQTVVDLPICR
jgi:hypothetical protein